LKRTFLNLKTAKKRRKTAEARRAGQNHPFARSRTAVAGTLVALIAGIFVKRKG